MKIDLARMARRAGTRRKIITFSPIETTRAQAKDLATIYNRMLAPWYSARELIDALYAAELARVLQTDSVDDLSNLMDEMDRQVQRLVMTLTPALRDWALRLEKWHEGKWARTVLAGAGVNIATLIGPADALETIDAFLARNVALVRDISSQARGRIADAVFRGLQQRTPAREVGKEIAEATGMARKRANRVAADQNVKLSSALDAQRQREAGLDHWKWRHSGKAHPRLDHLARNGKIYTENTAPQDQPGQLPYCGCVRQAVLILDGEVLG